MNEPIVMKDVETDWPKIVSLWWAYTWRWLLIGWGLSLLVMIVLGVFGAADTFSTSRGLLGAGLVLAVQIASQLWAFQQITGKDFDGFRLALRETLHQAQLRQLEERIETE